MKKLLWLSIVGAVVALLWGGQLAPVGTSGARTPPAAETWAFAPEDDTFDANALLDLRSLNEAQAGESGFVRVNAAGDFVRGNGQPLRFWAVNSEVGHKPFVPTPLGPAKAADLPRHARFLAKRGVNLVRLHRQISPDLDAKPQARFTDINEAERDSIWRSVAAMRKEGIYTALSPYWSVPMKFAPDWLPGGAPANGFGLLFFDARLQAAYKQWLKQLLLEKNPYTGVPLAQDPSLALLQLQNEDSLLFWTVDQIKGVQRQALEERFDAFLRQKYSDTLQLAAAWQNDVDVAAIKTPPGQAPRMVLLNMAELTQTTGLRPGRSQRQADQTEFYGRLMFDFNQQMVRYLRDELGVKSLVNAGNWKTAHPGQLGDVERWSYTPGPVDAVNRYTSSVHQGPNAGWSVQEGDTYTSDSVLRNPRLMPLALRQTAGRPMLVTEGSWALPQAYAAEGPFLVAAYGALTGIDGYTWFNTTDEGWGPPQSANGYQPSQAKWSIANPDTMGNFPAAALAYRLGYVQRGQPVLSETRRLDELWRRQPALRPEEPSFDPNRDSDTPKTRGSATEPWPAEAFLIGPVQVAFDHKVSVEAAALAAGGKRSAATEANSLAASAVTSATPPGPDLSRWMSPGVIRANNDQIVLNHTAGFCTVDAPQVQGVAAHFAKAPVHQLSDVRLVSGNAFGAALVVSLDGAPLKTSKRVLVQYGTQSRPTGWQDNAARLSLDGGGTVPGAKVVSTGHAPWQVVKGQLQVSINNPALSRATVLDMNGMPTVSLPLQRSSAQVSFRFPDNAMYVVLQ
ncbi:MAG: hypothetical protein V4739_11500 [Pseudomonadota bacterium]